MFQILNDIWKRQRAVQFQYNSHSSGVSNSFQDHHTLHTSTNNGNSAAGKPSTCKYMGNSKYFMEWTCSTQCTCPQATATGSQTQRIISLEKWPSPAQWKDFCEQTPIDILSHYSSCFEGIGHFPGELYKFHLNLSTSQQDMLQGKFQSTLRMLLKRKSSLWWN